jgi:hypothetical protein
MTSLHWSGLHRTAVTVASVSCNVHTALTVQQQRRCRRVPGWAATALVQKSPRRDLMLAVGILVQQMLAVLTCPCRAVMLRQLLPELSVLLHLLNHGGLVVL